MTNKKNIELEKTGSSAVGEKPVGVLLADPLPTVVAGLAMAIDAEPDLQVFLNVSSPDEMLSGMKQMRRRTNVVAIISMNFAGHKDCFWLIRRIRESFPSVAVVACGDNADKSVISRALFVGADGFLDKNSELPEFLEGIRMAAKGEVVIVGPPEDWLGPISEEILGSPEPEVVLTDREKEVLSLAAEGHTARQIGSQLGLRERTITTHLGRIYARLGVHGRVAAISQGARLGLIEARR